MSQFPIADHAQTIQPFRVMKILGEAKAMEAAGRDIIHMEIGEPDFASLDCIHQAVNQATAQGLTHYTPSLGLPALRKKLSAFYNDFYQASVNAEHIMITPGSSSGLHLLLSALLNPKDKVIMADRAYPCNRQFVKLLHGELLAIPTDASIQYQLNTELLKQHWQPDIKVVMVATPSNPTGTVIEQPALINMAQFCAERNAYLLVDEIYQGLVYDRPAESILAHANLPENVLVINSFSKFFGMTGWRLGWIVAPPFLLPTLERLAQNCYLAAPTPSQYGALAVLEKDALAQLEQRRKAFEQRRNQLFSLMQQANIAPSVLPQGAFYLYWDVSKWTTNSEQFCEALLKETGVAITPGSDFGEHQAKHHVRLAYTTDKNSIEKAVQKIAGFVNALENTDKA